MNTEKAIPKPHQLQQSTAGEEDPGAGLDAEDSAIHPDGVAPTARPGEPVAPHGQGQSGKRTDERR